jgi:tripartite-type tricarboxylate transporter receptor subunit TctC
MRRNNFSKICIALAASAGLFGLLGSAYAQTYPTKPITVIVPFPAGGSTDAAARMAVAALSRALGGASIVVENISGASGVIGMNRLRSAAPDGYTIGVGTIGTHVIVPAISKKAPYDPVADFAPVGLIGSSPMMLVTRPNFPAKNIKEFVAYLEANKGKVSYGSAGIGSQAHYGCVMLLSALKQDVTHVPYRGVAPAMTDLMGGQIDFLCDQPSSAMALAQSGKVKAIAALSNEKIPAMPNLPTAPSQGYPETNVRVWTALFAPKGTPPAILDKLNAALKQAALTDEQMKAQAKTLAFDLPAGYSTSAGAVSALIVIGGRRDGELLRARKEYLD